MHYWFFGFPGSGKSYVAKLLSEMTGMPCHDGDDFHTEEDRRVIAQGRFTPAHRHAQLQKIACALADVGLSDAIITHPLPDQVSRTNLRSPSSRLVYVQAPVSLIKDRLTARTGHHFGPTLLDAWIPQHWQDPEGEDVFVIRNDGSHDLQFRLGELLGS